MSARLRFVPRLNIITVRLGAFGFRVRLLYILMHSKECFLFFREKCAEYKFQRKITNIQILFYTKERSDV